MEKLKTIVIILFAIVLTGNAVISGNSIQIVLFGLNTIFWSLNLIKELSE